MDAEFAKWLATLGVGGALAAMMFIFYRKSEDHHAEQLEMHSQQWRGLTEQMMQIVKENSLFIRENTAASTKLFTLIDSLHRRLDDDRPNGGRKVPRPS